MSADSYREMIVNFVNATLIELSHAYTSVKSNVPGSSVVFRYVQKSYQDDPFRVALEVLLFVFAMRYLVAKKYQPDAREVPLSAKEVDELIRDWQPDTLVPQMGADDRRELDRVPVIVGPAGSHVKLRGAGDKEFLNLASYDFLGMCDRKDIHDSAIVALRKYGVGACGPPGFYGTLDVHIQLEQYLARFIGTEGAIIYAQAYSCVSGVIPAFSKKGDILVVDEGVSFSIQKGVQISRSTIRYFKHNDMQDLEKVLAEVQKDDKLHRRPLTRRFIVVEGLYQNTGNIVPLPKLMELKNKFKYRLIVDESLSFGVLGKRGAGVTDHFDIEAKSVDIITSSLAHSLASGGGFCAGSAEVVDHQRLSGMSYCFSAALPAMLAVAAHKALEDLEQDPGVLAKLRANIATFRSSFGSSRFAHLQGAAESPTMHLQLAANFTNVQANNAIADILDLVRRDCVLATRAKYSDAQELLPVQPSIRICITAAMEKKKVEHAASSLKKAVDSIVGQGSTHNKSAVANGL